MHEGKVTADCRVLIDTFSALDDLKGKDRRDKRKILAALAKAGRFSCFEVDDVLAGPLTWILLESGWVETDNSRGMPWTYVTLTDEGQAQLLQVPEAAALLQRIEHGDKECK